MFIKQRTSWRVRFSKVPLRHGNGAVNEYVKQKSVHIGSNDEVSLIMTLYS